eukprot:6207486-Pleurochrysis_carterae.AAC.2
MSAERAETRAMVGSALPRGNCSQHGEDIVVAKQATLRVRMRLKASTRSDLGSNAGAGADVNRDASA